MGFSGKPSKGCAPCRAKRTKCDLAQPACTQCVRKNRLCTGYRNEQDLLFRNETKLVMRKAQRRNDGTDSPSSSAFADELMHYQDLMHYQHPSRRAAVEEEAVLHYFAHYSEKYFLSDSEGNQAGFDYILPVYQEDMKSGGPIPEIIRANGMAALGNAKGSPELLVAARAKQVKVLRHLTKQLQDPAASRSNSSILTCLMLGAFENIICDSPQCAQAMTYHLKGASALASLRGPSQFDDNIGRGIYAKMRGTLLAHCLQRREPLPDFVTLFFDNEQVSQRDFEPQFYELIGRLCKVRADHKNKGFIPDELMAIEAQQLMDELIAWEPKVSNWDPDRRPSPTPGAIYSADDTYRFVWRITIWLFKHTGSVLASEIVIEWARAKCTVSPSASCSATLEGAVQTQKRLCQELVESTLYYLKELKNIETGMRTIGGYTLLWPIYVLSTSSTSTLDTMIWITEQSEKVAEEFGIRQAKVMADFLRMYTTVPTTTG